MHCSIYKFLLFKCFLSIRFFSVRLFQALGCRAVVLFAPLVVVSGLSGLAHAGIDTYEFDSPDDHDRYSHFIEELRCPKCKNQNLAGSNAPIAQDLRRELHRLIKEDADNDDIVDFMVDRYGDFVLYRPPLQGNTYALWFGTLGMFLLGLVILIVVILRRSRTSVANGDLTEGEQEKLDQFLHETQASTSNSSHQSKKKK